MCVVAIVFGAGGGGLSSHGDAGTSAPLAYAPSRRPLATFCRSCVSARIEKCTVPPLPGVRREIITCPMISSGDQLLSDQSIRLVNSPGYRFRAFGLFSAHHRSSPRYGCCTAPVFQYSCGAM